MQAVKITPLREQTYDCRSPDTRAFELHESNVRTYCRTFPVVFTRAAGSFVYDELGNWIEGVGKDVWAA
ncbi:MAG: hypothetical protein EOO38_25960 [Cytophagaceae bacterium]|nr:MAG: hypothetical protein EOO38_25960 [Cytophagaceae bacterium]